MRVEATMATFIHFPLEPPSAYRKSDMDLISRSFKCWLYVFRFSFTFYLMNYQGSTTRERYLIASGTNDKMPEINVWEKKVSFEIYSRACILSDFQRGRDILSGDEVAGATWLRWLWS